MTHTSPSPVSGNAALVTLGMVVIACVIFGAGYMAGRGTQPTPASEDRTAQADTTDQPAQQQAQTSAPQGAQGVNPLEQTVAQQAAQQPEETAEDSSIAAKMLNALQPTAGSGAGAGMNNAPQPSSSGQGQGQGQAQPENAAAMQQQMIDQQSQLIEQQQQLEAARQELLQQQRDAVPSPMGDSPPSPVSLGGQY